MNKKVAYFVVLSLTLILIVVVGGVLMTDTNPKSVLSSNRETDFYWVSSESRFIDYKITDNGMVKFRYSIRFVNESDQNHIVSLSAKFKSKELKGWIENRSFFIGNNDRGEMLYAEIKAGDQADIVFVFEGKYLGGNVNESLSFPEEIILMSQ